MKKALTGTGILIGVYWLLALISGTIESISQVIRFSIALVIPCFILATILMAIGKIFKFIWK